MPIFRLARSFTAGEISPLMNTRVDFERFRNGCKKLTNMVVTTQGPAVRRSGFKFVFDLTSIGYDPEYTPRMIPFIFNELQAYVMVFFRHTSGRVWMVLGTTNDDGTDGLVLTGTGEVMYLEMPVGFDKNTFDWAQSGDEMYTAQSTLAPLIIRRLDHNDWEVVSVTFTDQPDDWSAANGWPEKVTFHQQRLAYGANTIRRQTIWMSKAGDFGDFGVSATLVDSDAVTFTLDSGTQNKIKWMTSGKSLHVGTLGNEWTVTGNDRAALTPENVLAQRQTNSGSEDNKPLLVGLTTLFIERHGRVVNEFVYDYTFDSYKTSDMAILSPHLTEFYSITDWTYQQTPDSIIWCVREDGDIIAITYQRQHKVVGWHHHETDGEVFAISAIPGETREDDVWTVTRRVADGVSKFYLEKLGDMFKSESAVDARFLDSYRVYDGAPTTTISGLDNLLLREVHVLADGTVHPPVTVSATGTITLNNSYSVVVVGLPYVSEVRPFLMDVGGNDGTSLGRSQRITNLVVDVYRSLGMTIGRGSQEDGDSEEDVAFRVPTDLMGQAVPLFSGWYPYAFPEGFDMNSEYFIKQEQPLPLTVRGVVDEVEVYE